MDVRLPADLQASLNTLLHATSRTELSARSMRISEGYRRNEPSSQSVLKADDALAYALSRLPATYAAVIAVFSQIAQTYPEFAPQSLLDMGTGPGTAAWAACAVWPTLHTVRMVDHNAQFLALASELARGSDNPALQTASVERGDLLSKPGPDTYDLVIASYAMTELAEVTKPAANLFARSHGMMVLIEPGRPRDYARLLEVRSHLLAQGAQTLAPCPHDQTCPLPEGDWCHFSARLPRSRDHMQAKGGTVPFEDEKFSYLAMSTLGLDTLPRFSRVLAPPMHSKHDVALKLCTFDGLENRVVRSRDKLAFRQVNKLEWGDSIAD